MKVFVIGDIHGNHKALVQVLQRSGFDYLNDQLITLGDIVDGLPDSYECVEELLKIENRIDIMGNHDEWFREFIITGIHPMRWSQGGLATASSYGNNVIEEFQYSTKYQSDPFGNKEKFYITNLNSADIPTSHQNFFRKQVRYYRTHLIEPGGKLFVHAGFNRHLKLVEQVYHDIFWWDRDLWMAALSAESANMNFKMKDGFEEVFIGHTDTTRWDRSARPMQAKNIFNLDTGAGFEGKLTIMNVETKEYWQSDPVKHLYPDYRGRE